MSEANRTTGEEGLQWLISPVYVIIEKLNSDDTDVLSLFSDKMVDLLLAIVQAFGLKTKISASINPTTILAEEELIFEKDKRKQEMDSLLLELKELADKLKKLQ